MRKKCDANCVSAFQDKMYGPGIRVHNEDKKGTGHCTVCGGNPSVRKSKSIAAGWKPLFSQAPKNDGIKHPIS